MNANTSSCIKTAIHMAFIMDGADLFGDALAEVRDKNNLGHFEVVAELAPFAFVLHELESKAGSVVDNYPGVFDYEVSIEFGKWYSRYLIEHSELPTHEECHQYLVDAVYQFFKQANIDSVTDVKLRRALGLDSPFEVQTLVIEACATDNDVDSPRYAMVDLSESFIAELDRLAAIVHVNDIESVNMSFVPTWEDDDSFNMQLNELHVEGKWFSFIGYPADENCAVETSSIDFQDLKNALDGVFPQFSNPFAVSNGRLYYSRSGDCLSLIELVENAA